MLAKNAFLFNVSKQCIVIALRHAGKKEKKIIWDDIIS